MKRRFTFTLEKFQVRYILRSDQIPNHFDEHSCYDLGRYSHLFAFVGAFSHMEVHLFLFLYRFAADDSFRVLLLFGKPKILAIQKVLLKGKRDFSKDINNQ